MITKSVAAALFFLAAAASLLTTSAPAQPLRREPIQDVDPTKPPATAEALEAAKSFKLPRGLEARLFAAEPQLVSPVAIATDERGRIYVVETFRAWGNGGMDMRGFPEWLEDDLAARTVQDRISWIRRRAGEDAQILTLDTDRVRLLEDKDGDGRADSATIFTDGYHALEDGIAAGVLPRRNGEVYFADIPSLYVLKDTNDDAKADERRILHTGFGVHYQFLGHDLHGLVIGPDGRLYFSIGDRGAHVKTKEGKILDNPDSGAVFRCDPDGSNLEIVHTGLRNPQELAFDQYGNLFTADNNCDMGDRARWVYIVEGGDSGWRCGYQYIEEPNPGGPWLAEKLWHLDSDHPAAWCLPTVGHAPSGPSGLAFYPGTGMGDKYKDQFFLCDFRGGVNSGVWTFALRNKGASFEIAQRRQFFWNLLPTDVAFANDGGLYVSDWVNGWFRPMKARIWKVVDPQAAQSAIVLETRKLITEGMSKRTEKDLIGLLAHPDQRVRLEAQFELAARQSETIVSRLHKLISLEDADPLARIHAIWCLSQLARKDANVLEPVVKLLDDGDSEIRAQAAKAIGDARYTKSNAYDFLLRRLKDDTPRVRFFAAMAIAKIGTPPPPESRESGTSSNSRRPTPASRLLDMLRENDNRDAYLRHAGVMALLGFNDPKVLEGAWRDASPAVRLAALLALRRSKDPAVAGFLADPAPLNADEAARAIYDEPIPAALPRLAAALWDKPASRAIWLRAISANLRLGGHENAQAVAKVAAKKSAANPARVEALWALANWDAPPHLDRVTGLYRPAPSRQPGLAASAASDSLPDLITNAPTPVRIAAIEALQKLGVHAELLDAVAANEGAPPPVRAAALRAMDQLKRPNLARALDLAFNQGRGTVLRKTAIALMMRQPDAGDRIGPIFNTGDLADRKAVLEALAAAPPAPPVPPGIGDTILAAGLDSLLNNTLPAELQLDLLEAAGKSKDPRIAEKLKSFEAHRDTKTDPLANWSELLAGGDIAKGRRIFFQNGTVSCLRCHKVGTDAVVVGPDLAGIAAKKDRRYLLESVLKPNAQVAPGFQQVILNLKDGDTIYGTLKKETDTTLFVQTPDEDTITEVARDQVADRRNSLSPMPEGFDKLLNKRELRDLIEFLASLKDERQTIDPLKLAEQMREEQSQDAANGTRE
jgi:quinoprotein glucose dehydrogenase